MPVNMQIEQESLIEFLPDFISPKLLDVVSRMGAG